MCHEAEMLLIADCNFINGKIIFAKILTWQSVDDREKLIVLLKEIRYARKVFSADKK